MNKPINKKLTMLLVPILVFGLYVAVPQPAQAAPQSARAADVKTTTASADPILHASGTPFNIGLRGNNDSDPAKGVYVSPSGNDSTATGTIDKPYKSINTALIAAPAGSTIILRSGTYTEGENVRIRKANVTIKSRKGEWAVIDLTKFKSGCDEDSGVYFDVDSSGGRLKNVEVIGGFYAVCMETKWDWGNPKDRTGASNIIIEDCILHDSRYDTVKVKPNCNNITIRYNEIYNSGRAFPGSTSGDDNAEGIDNVNGNKMLVQNNYIHDIVGNGIYAKGGATDVVIENNLVEGAYGAGIMVGFDTSPEFFDTKLNPQYYENIRGTVRNNLIIDSGWEGIGLYASKDAQVYNNTLVNVNKGGLYHSALYFGLTYQDWETYAKRPANTNPNIHHNIISQPGKFNRQMIEIRYDASTYLGILSALSGKPTMNNNCYYIDGKKSSFTDNRPSGVKSVELAAWKSHISGESGTIEVDPGLDADYVATNPLCLGMGIQPFLKLPAVSIKPTPLKTHFTYSLTSKAYTGKAQGISVTPKSGAGKISAVYYAGINGTVYKKSTKIPKKIGSYAVSIDAAAGTKFGSVKNLSLGSYKIVPSRISLSAKVKVGKKQMKVKWKKAPKAQKISKYELRYREKGKSKWTTKTIKASGNSATLKKLKKGRQYQVQIRSYKMVSGYKYASAWSKIKTSARIK